jgi:APA family basic amino acid/polyamine antiporter
VGASAVAAGWSAYFTGLLKAAGVELPKHLTSVPAGRGLVICRRWLSWPCVTALLVAGTKESAGFNKRWCS